MSISIFLFSLILGQIVNFPDHVKLSQAGIFKGGRGMVYGGRGSKFCSKSDFCSLILLKDSFGPIMIVFFFFFRFDLSIGTNRIFI